MRGAAHLWNACPLSHTSDVGCRQEGERPPSPTRPPGLPRLRLMPRLALMPAEGALPGTPGSTDSTPRSARPLLSHRSTGADRAALVRCSLHASS